MGKLARKTVLTDIKKIKTILKNCVKGLIFTFLAQDGGTLIKNRKCVFADQESLKGRLETHGRAGVKPW